MATAETKPHVSEFVNEPFIDFSRPENRKRMQEALTKVAGELGREYPMYIGGQKVITTEKKTSTNPSHPSQAIGVFQSASVEQANQAVEAAAKAFETWKRVPAEQRVQCLFRAAQILRDRKYEMNALIVYEAGKTWPEADADTAETIDFLEFYGREMLRLAGPQKVVPMKGEKNYLVYIPLGVGVVIPPWNFPLAIMVGMTTASLVAGNTVVIKPAEETSLSTIYLAQLAQEVGIPPGVINVVTGSGEVTGAALARHPGLARLYAGQERGARVPLQFAGLPALGPEPRRTAVSGSRRLAHSHV